MNAGFTPPPSALAASPYAAESASLPDPLVDGGGPSDTVTAVVPAWTSIGIGICGSVTEKPSASRLTLPPLGASERATAGATWRTKRVEAAGSFVVATAAALNVSGDVPAANTARV